MPIPVTISSAQQEVVRYRGPPPIVMFRPISAFTPNPLALRDEFDEIERGAFPITGPRADFIVSAAERDTEGRKINPANSAPTTDEPPINFRFPILAPPAIQSAPHDIVASQTDHTPFRKPLRRIYEDTRLGIVRDIPEAIADALPWVDRDRKNEPFDQVLDRVADDLHRASVSDPEWALGAQREIRDLSKKLSTFSAPPPLPRYGENSLEREQITPIIQQLADRPFRPRPIWPGASGRPEAQVRPITITTASGELEGPRTSGVAGGFSADPISDGEAAPRVTSRGAQAAGRATSSRSRPNRSR